ncbi:hypothetical protein RchiOBHm_Chr5g0070601 [Rosa chinensis]|uniref:Transmembrane protein n=1 Tax=Rosa chinensis TaxID=74649 RepID=A0A2P6QK72_ROSCH|nr:hypothetical protein RchiOBHm_Chr5g0070601 [Rosa chinensis]
MILALTATWAAAAAAPHHKFPAMSSAPAMAPNNQDEILFSDDKHYALHGEIMLVVLIVLFIAFVSCLAVVTRIRRAGAVEEDLVSKNLCNCYGLLGSLVRKKRNRGDEDAAPESPLRASNEIPESLPHEK